MPDRDGKMEKQWLKVNLSTALGYNFEVLALYFPSTLLFISRVQVSQQNQ